MSSLYIYILQMVPKSYQEEESIATELRRWPGKLVHVFESLKSAVGKTQEQREGNINAFLRHKIRPLPSHSSQGTIQRKAYCSDLDHQPRLSETPLAPRPMSYLSVIAIFAFISSHKAIS